MPPQVPAPLASLSLLLCSALPTLDFSNRETESNRLAKMKLLGWMHRKFRQNSGDGFKDYGGGGGGGGTCNCLSSGRQSFEVDDELHGRRRRRQYEPFKARSLRLGLDELSDEGGGDPAVEELFGGLLTIGTLGIGSGPIQEKEEEEDVENTAESEDEDEDKPLVAVPEELVITPAALEAIAEKQAEATTETDLMVVSAELEKVLAAEAEKGGGRMSSARSSQAGAAACPLQGFLFGSPIEVAETVTAAALAGAGARKSRRASLGELFLMSQIAEEGGVGKQETAKFATGDSEHDAEVKLTAEMCLMKKKMKKRRGQKRTEAGTESNGSTVEKKFQKILQMFHRKVHPESSLMSKKTSKTAKIEKKDHVPGVGGNDPSTRKENTPTFNFCSNPSSYTFTGGDISGNRGHWIKTDAEYLVLEL